MPQSGLKPRSITSLFGFLARIFRSCCNLYPYLNPFPLRKVEGRVRRRSAIAAKRRQRQDQQAQNDHFPSSTPRRHPKCGPALSDIEWEESDEIRALPKIRSLFCWPRFTRVAAEFFCEVIRDDRLEQSCRDPESAEKKPGFEKLTP